MFRKILVPVDGSDCSWKALEKAIELGRSFGSKILAVHVVQQPILPYADNVSGVFIDRVIESLMEQGREILRRASEMLERAGLEFEAILETGQPAETIISLADKLEVDLVVIGSRGTSKVKRLLLGGTSDAVVHHVKCPVLVVK